MNQIIFEVEISSNGPKGYETATMLAMPCTLAEYHNALQKARIKDGQKCKNELTQICYPGITPGMIGHDVDLLELDLLAIRLASLGEDDRMGLDGLLRAEQAHRNGPIPLSRLINLTFNTDICLLAPHVSSDAELGALLYESGGFSRELTAVLDDVGRGTDLQDLLLTVFGQRHRLTEGGAFTRQGYVEPGKDFKEVYQTGEIAAYFTQAGGPVVLEVTNGTVQEHCSGQDPPVTLTLPAVPGAISDMMQKMGVVSVAECAFRCADCLIPSLRDVINDTIDDEGGIEQVNEFARRLEQQQRVWDEADTVKYKALLAASGHPSLQDAMELMGVLEDYEFRPEVAEPWDYAELVLREKYPDLPEELFQTGQSAQIGQKMLDEGNALITDYGLIRRKDGGQLPVFERNVQGQEMTGPQLGGM